VIIALIGQQIQYKKAHYGYKKTESAKGILTWVFPEMRKGQM
jgi:hypothetical protein